MVNFRKKQKYILHRQSGAKHQKNCRNRQFCVTIIKAISVENVFYTLLIAQRDTFHKITKHKL